MHRPAPGMHQTYVPLERPDKRPASGGMPAGYQGGGRTTPSGGASGGSRTPPLRLNPPQARARTPPPRERSPGENQYDGMPSLVPKLAVHPGTNFIDIRDKGPQVRVRAPSSKVHQIASDIAQLESRCEWLEQRNETLTQRLLVRQTKYLQENVVHGLSQLKIAAFHAWRDLSREVGLAGHLAEQTRSLDRCQAVARDLGDALTQEQSARADIERSLAMAQEEFETVMEQEADLTRQLQEEQLMVELLERRCQEAEGHFRKMRDEAMNVLGHHKNYEDRKLDIEDEFKYPSKEDPRDPRHPIQQSKRLRQEANDVMQKVTSLMDRRGVSPEREA